VERCLDLRGGAQRRLKRRDAVLDALVVDVRDGSGVTKKWPGVAPLSRSPPTAPETRTRSAA
jgi:hypothetical protein